MWTQLVAGLKLRVRSRFCAARPVFSVVIPIFDRTGELRQAIESVLRQTFRNFELLLVCDGSPPGTLEVVQEYAAQPQVRIHRFPDTSGNACRGRNQGIAMARGELIAFLDSDDIAMPDRLKLTAKAVWTQNADMIFGAARFMADGTRILPGIRDGQIVPARTFELPSALDSNPVIASTAAVKKTCLDRWGAFRPGLQYREDHELWLRLAFRGCRIVALPDVLAGYRLHGGNAELKFKDRDPYWKAEMLRLYQQDFHGGPAG